MRRRKGEKERGRVQDYTSKVVHHLLIGGLAQRKAHPARRAGWAACLLPESNDPGSRRQNRPLFRQHFLNRLPEPHGQRSFLPNFSANSLSPWTIRTPRFTFVSDGKPLRRLLIGSKRVVRH